MSHPIREVAPGILHWTARHPNIGQDVSSYYLTGPRVLLNPITPPDGTEWFLTGPPPVAIVLTNHHHVRDSAQFVERFGLPVRVVSTGAGQVEGMRVEPFAFGDTIVDGVTAYHVSDAWPDETALGIPGCGALAVADAVVDFGQGLAFVPDELMGDDPEGEKRELAAGLARAADAVEFDHLLLAHGDPVIGNGRQALREFLAPYA